MKKTGLFFVFTVLLCFTLSSQVELINQSVTDVHAKYVYNGKENVLYIVNSNEDNDYAVKLGDVSLEKQDLNHFIFKGPYARNVQFDLYENGTLIKSEAFSGRRLPNSDIRFGNMEGVTASNSELLATPFLTVYNPSTFLATGKDSIQQFVMSIRDQEGEIKHVFEVTKGCQFTPEQIGMISVLQAGDQIEISELWLVDSDGILSKKFPFSIFIR